MVLSDQEFVAQFEACTLPPSEFKHIGHLRIAWWYLCQYDLEQAIEAVSQGIQAYAESLGADKKFHRTVTEALVRIIAARMSAARTNAMNECSWPTFLQQNQDLVINANDILQQHYHTETLASERARLNFIAPDKQAFE